MSDDNTTRANRGRYYIEGDTVIHRFGGDDTVHSFTGVADDVWHRLALEGYIHLRTLGASHTDITAGQAFKDRIIPTGPKKEPSSWVKAIANVKALDLLRATKAGGEKPDKAQIAAFGEQAMAWVKTLNSDQIKLLKANKAVMVAHAELSGTASALDDMLVEHVEEELQEAAD